MINARLRFLQAAKWSSSSTPPFGLFSPKVNQPVGLITLLTMSAALLFWRDNLSWKFLNTRYKFSSLFKVRKTVWYIHTTSTYPPHLSTETMCLEENITATKLLFSAHANIWLRPRSNRTFWTMPMNQDTWLQGISVVLLKGGVGRSSVVE